MAATCMLIVDSNWINDTFFKWTFDEIDPTFLSLWFSKQRWPNVWIPRGTRKSAWRCHLELGDDKCWRSDNDDTTAGQWHETTQKRCHHQCFIRNGTSTSCICLCLCCEQSKFNPSYDQRDSMLLNLLFLHFFLDESVEYTQFQYWFWWHTWHFNWVFK